MSEIDRIVDQLRRAYDGDPWHGPSARAALEGVDARLAMTRHVKGGHTICEIVLHMTAWTREVTRRLRIGIAQEPEPGDWPPAAGDEASWPAAIAALDAANAELVEAIAALDEAQLEDRIGDVRDRALGTGVSRYITLHGLIQHHVYHAGQISLLKRAAEASAEFLFSYGTLQLEAVQMATFGRRLTGTPDVLPEFEAASIEIEDQKTVTLSGKTHHSIARFTGRPSDTVAGTVYPLTSDEIQRADAYEVAAYKRVAARLQSGVRAWVYVDAQFAPADEIRESDDSAPSREGIPHA